MTRLVFLNDCDGCGMSEERLFVDSWTGTELCTDCLAPVITQVTNSPASEGDNLHELLDLTVDA
jgi:hypothetical protein